MINVLPIFFSICLFLGVCCVAPLVMGYNPVFGITDLLLWMCLAWAVGFFSGAVFEINVEPEDDEPEDDHE